MKILLQLHTMATTYWSKSPFMEKAT
jgi:hypothetical protein